MTSSNVVAESKLASIALSAGLNDLKPPDCFAIAVAELRRGTGDLLGGPANDLMLGGSSSQNLDGGAGADCISGGGGDDTITGGSGEDVCIGGPGLDTFIDCETTVQDTVSG
jgi:Ca2+-binding RTX toxin-like protein